VGSTPTTSTYEKENIRYQNNLRAIETTRRQTKEEVDRILVQLDELNKLI